MSNVQELIRFVKEARRAYITQIESVSEIHARWKPSQEVWNIIEVTEHLYWAEHGGILGMWKTLHAIRSGQMERTLESAHKGFSIDEIIRLTWKPKEQVPAVAAPRMGGSLAFWRNALWSLQTILDSFGEELREDELRVQAHPHPISGPMDFQQRLEFLTFHIKRHQNQVTGLLQTIQDSSN